MDTDLVVLGGGSAGCVASLAAARNGVSRVLLVERYGFLGGISTQSLDTFYGFFTPGDRPKKVVGGVPDIVVDRLAQEGEMFLRPNTYGAGTGVTYNPERLKLLWDELTEEYGVEVLLHTEFDGAETLTNGGFKLSFRHRGGHLAVRARRAIDTSGDAVLSTMLGAPIEEAGTTESAQTFTTTFRMCNVDYDRFREQGGKKMLQQRMADAVENGRHMLPRKKGSVHPMVQPNCIATVAVRVPFASPFDPHALSAAEREGRRQTFVYERFLRAEVPGFEHAKVIAMSSPQIGIRESRRVYGEYRLTREDCLSRATFDDSVMVCGAPIEDHRQNEGGEEETEWVYIPDGGVYEVPYRCFVPRGVGDLWVAGRCFSATHSAQASCRSMGQTMSMGQAVGTAAAISLARECGSREVPTDELRERLQDMGAVVSEPEESAWTGRDDWLRNRPPTHRR
jgi:hypothetical protein